MLAYGQRLASFSFIFPPKRTADCGKEAVANLYKRVTMTIDYLHAARKTSIRGMKGKEEEKKRGREEAK